MPAIDQVKKLFSDNGDKLAEDLAAEIDSANAATADLTTKLNSANDEITTLTGEIAAREADLSAQNAQIQTLTAQVADLKAKLAPAPAGGFAVVLQNMAEVYPGVYHSTNLDAPKASGGQVAVVHARFHIPAQPGQTVVVSYDQTTNVIPDGTKNIKDFRAWPDPSTPYPNHYTGRTVGSGDNSITAENNDGVVLYHSLSPTRWNVGYFHMPIKPDVKQHIEQTIRFSSAPGQADGYAKIVVDGVTVFESDGFMVNGPREDFGPQMVYAPLSGDSGPLPAGSYFQVEKLALSVA